MMLQERDKEGWCSAQLRAISSVTAPSPRPQTTQALQRGGAAVPEVQPPFFTMHSGILLLAPLAQSADGASGLFGELGAAKSWDLRGEIALG